jgi:phosphoglucomutase
VGKDTYALSGPAERTAFEVLAANCVETIIQGDDEFTPTPVLSHRAAFWCTTERTANAPLTESLLRLHTIRRRMAALSTTGGGFAVRPSGTEDIYKIYVERFKDRALLNTTVEQTKLIVEDALGFRSH